tara:strand:- start:367 stop:663 length:297 start_codon:yes stop_codon:yes gene_type:complete
MWLTKKDFKKAKYREIYKKDKEFISQICDLVYLINGAMECIITDLERFSDSNSLFNYEKRFRASLTCQEKDIYDQDLDVLKLKCMIKMKEAGLINKIM